MAGPDDSRALRAVTSRLPAPLDGFPVVVLVGCIVLAGLLARLVVLGARPHHWDEARVAYWTLYAHEQGSFAYRRIIHGPFVQHTARWLFALLGPSDFVSRLPVAVVGALFPATALLFRGRLRDDETVALALFLAFNPVLLYYSRFMRSDVLVAAFALAAFGCAVRLLDDRRPRYVYGIALFGVLALSAKENAILYPVTWLGALALLADRALDTPGSDVGGVHRIRAVLARTRDRVDLRAGAATYGPHLILAAVLAVLLFVFMFAPRGDGVSGLLYPPTDDGTPGLWEAMSAPGAWPDLLSATGGQFVSEYGGWAGSSGDRTFGQYIERVGASLRGIGIASGVLSVTALLGFVRERYTLPGGRPLVMLFFFAGIASLIGYPLGYSIASGYKWNITHILVPLAVPAAVGLAATARWLVRAYADGELLDRALVGVFVVGVVALAGWQAATLVYLDPMSNTNEIVQHGQPADDLAPVLEQFQAAAETEDPDVLFYGDATRTNAFVLPSDRQTEDDILMNFAPPCTNWAESLPLNWYVYRTNASADCVDSESILRQRVVASEPALIVAEATDPSTPREWLSNRYVATNYSLRSSDASVPRATVFVRQDIAAVPVDDPNQKDSMDAFAE